MEYLVISKPPSHSVNRPVWGAKMATGWLWESARILMTGELGYCDELCIKRLLSQEHCLGLDQGQLGSPFPVLRRSHFIQVILSCHVSHTSLNTIISASGESSRPSLLTSTPSLNWWSCMQVRLHWHTNTRPLNVLPRPLLRNMRVSWVRPGGMQRSWCR